MGRHELEKLWHDALASPSEERFDEVARSVVEVYTSDARFRELIKNRSKRVTTRTGVLFDPDNLEIESARAFVADEIGFTSWDDLIVAIGLPEEKSILFRYAIAAMERGDFTSLEEAIGAEGFHDQIVEWYESGMFNGEQETLNEILSAACMLGQTNTAEYLIDRGVDPYAGMRTWLAGPHYGVSSGRLETVKMLIDMNVPLEVENKYGGTMLGQALWSAINEHTDDHAEIIEILLKAGAVVEPGTSEWWEQQNVPSSETKERVAKALRDAERANTGC